MEDQKNFSLMTTDQLLLSHDQIHQLLEISDEADCAEIRTEHDAIAAEMVRRGMEHDTGVICPEPEVVTDAPNYTRSFAENTCSNCVFGAVDQWCSLYKFQYISDFVCDSWQPFDTLELSSPHGFLVGKGKQTAIASDKELVAGKPLYIVSDGEVFGIATLDQPATMKESEFDRAEWHEKHCIFPRERRQWWPEAEKFYVHPISEWQSFKPTKVFADGKVMDELPLSNEQQQIAYKARQLPKTIIVAPDVVGVSEDNHFIIDPSVSNKCGLENALAATYETDIKMSEAAEFMPVYSLALVRNPRMRMSKKNENAKQEEDDMPWEVELRGDEYCVIKVDDGEVEGCHDTREQANAQLAALNISEQEGESAYEDDPKKRRRRRKKEQSNKQQSLEQRMNFIRGQFEDEFNRNSSLEIASDDSWIWLADVFESFVIAEDDGKLFRVSFMETDEGLIFSSKDQWIEVERGYSPKGFKHLHSYSKQVQKETWLTKAKNAIVALTDLLGTENEKEVDISEEMFKGNSGFAAIKAANGEPWHFTWSTNAFEDREGEIFTTKALEQYAAENDEKERKAKERGEKYHRGFFNFWHINEGDGNFNTDFAEKKWQGVIGRFLVESGPYLDNENGQAALKFFQEFSDGHPLIAPEGWGCSPEFRYLPEERAKGVYDWLFIVRTSTLPRAAAANIWTQSKQEGDIVALSEQQKEAAAAWMKGGMDRVNELITEGESKTQALEDAGVANKENNEQPEEVQKPIEVNLDIDELAEAVGKNFEINFGAIGEMVGTIADSLKQLQADVAELQQGAKVKTQTETPRYVVNLQQASKAEETVVSEGNNLNEQKPKEEDGTNGGGMDRHFFGPKK